MQLLSLSLPTSAENLALDEALLDWAESNEAETSRAGQPGRGEILRLWEPAAPMVVVGRSSRLDEEVHRDACRARGIPVLRRCSGGAAIVAGPGCLMYAVVLSYERRPQLRRIDAAHRFVLERITRALAPLVPELAPRGTSDLAIDGRKVSGNSLRCKRTHLLYHGTLLYDFSAELIAACLKPPPRQPDYRAGRAHTDFLTNLPLDRAALIESVIQGWNAHEPTTRWPQPQVATLVRDRYSQATWNEVYPP